MEKAIAAVTITVASIAAIITVLDALMPAILRTNSSTVSAADSDSPISTQPDIIEASGKDGGPAVDAWMKNSGGIETSPSDLAGFFSGAADSSVCMLYRPIRCSASCWSYTLENDTVWNPTATVHLSASTDASLTAAGTYYIKVAPNGIGVTRYLAV